MCMCACLLREGNSLLMALTLARHHLAFFCKFTRVSDFAKSLTPLFFGDVIPKHGLAKLHVAIIIHAVIQSDSLRRLKAMAKQPPHCKSKFKRKQNQEIFWKMTNSQQQSSSSSSNRFY